MTFTPFADGPPPLSAEALNAALTQIDNPIATGTTTARGLVARFADTLNAKDFGAKGDGVTNDTVALQTWAASMNAGGAFSIAAGVYICNGPLTVNLAANANLTVVGEGSGQVEIRFGGTGNGWVISGQSVNSSSLNFSGMSLTKVGVVGRSGTAFSLSNTSGAQQLNPNLEDVKFKLGAQDGNGWLNCMVFNRCNHIVGKRLEWALYATYTATGVFCTINGIDHSSFSVDHHFSDIYVEGGSTGFLLDGYVQGISIVQADLITQNIGIDWNCSSGTAAEFLNLSNSYILSGYRCIRLVNNSAGFITDVLLQACNGLNGATLNTSWAALEVSDVNGYQFDTIQITGNSPTTLMTFTEAGIIHGVAGGSCGWCKWNNIFVGNTFGALFQCAGSLSFCSFNDLTISTALSDGSTHIALGNLPTQQDCAVGTATVNGLTYFGNGSNFFYSPAGEILGWSSNANIGNSSYPLNNVYTNNAFVTGRVGALSLSSQSSLNLGVTPAGATPGGTCDIAVYTQASSTPTVQLGFGGGSVGVVNSGTFTVSAAETSLSGGLAVWGATPPTSKPTITGSRGSATATVLESVLQALSGAGLLTDSTTT